ncbi:hypothetical protein Tco_1384520 [Tanacetum coccineum]
MEAYYNVMAKIQEVLTANSGFDAEPLEKVQSNAEYNVSANEIQHSEQPESINDTYVVEKDDSSVISDSSNICDNVNQADQNVEECDDERVVLANLIANLKLNTDENKRIQKQLKKANTSLAHELLECKSALEKCKYSLEESNRTRDRYLVHFMTKRLYKRFNDCTLEIERLERKLKETQGLLAHKEIDSKEVLKTKGYEISVEKEKNNELAKQSSLTTSRYKSLIKEKKKIVQLIIFIVDSGCTKHMTGNLKLLCNFVEKYMSTIHFGNDQFAPILGYEDLVQGNITIKRVYYVEGLNHNLFLVGQFCDADLEVAFWKLTCFVRDLQGNDLLFGNRR